MRIAIDARWIFPEISGIGLYTRELLRHLPRVAPGHEFIPLFHDPRLLERTLAETDLAGRAGVRPELVPWRVFSPLSQLGMGSLLRRLGVSVYHSPNYLIPYPAFPRNRRCAIRCVTTVHDVIPLIFPGHTPRALKTRLFPLYRRIMIETGRRSHAILTVSQASARDIIQHLRIPAGEAARVHAIPNGVSGRFCLPTAAPVAPAVPDHARPRTILYVGRADPYKNLSVLLRAFHAARTRCPFPLRLRIVGPPDPRYPEPRRLADQLGLAPHIEWTGYLSDEPLVEAYRAADALVHPSRYEGFGLQILEAMACGLPVICSNAASLPEVAGDAAWLVPPDDAPGFATAIEQVLTDPATAERLRAAGLRRAARFSWEATARAVVAVYESLAPTASHKDTAP